MHKAIFFDRDGTLIENAHYLSSLDSVVLIESMLEFACLAQQRGYLLIGITNQSGIARGMFTELFVHETHKYLDKLFMAYNVAITAWYYCPHHPTAAVVEEYKKQCGCRKPLPGMLQQAAQDYSIDLIDSVMIGDSDSDIQAGHSAGCVAILVKEIVNLSRDEKIKLLDLLSSKSSLMQTTQQMMQK